MVSLAPSQSFRLVSCFALTQSVSLIWCRRNWRRPSWSLVRFSRPPELHPSPGVSRKTCTRSTFHVLPYSEFALHMRSRSERPSVGCSGSELRSDKDQNSAIKNTSGHRSASSLSYKRGSVSLLDGCSTPNIPTIIAFSPPSCATILHPDNEVLLSFAAHTLVYKLRPDVLRSSSASHPGSRVSPAMLVVNGPNFNCFWAWPSTTKEESGPLLSQSIPTAYHNESQLSTGLIILTSLKNSEGFLGIYIMPLLLYHSYRMNCSVDSLTLLPVLSSSSTKERILLPCLFSVKGNDSSGLIPRVCFNLLTGLPPCVAVCTGPEGAIETTSVSLVGEGWLSTSQHKVTKSQLLDLVLHASSTHSSFVLNSLSSSDEELSCLILIDVVTYVYFSRGCLIPSCYCSSSS